MPQLQIDSLVLQVPGQSESEGRQLACEVTRRLGEECAALAPGDIAGMRVEITADAAAGTTELGRQIVAGILREIRRLS